MRVLAVAQAYKGSLGAGVVAQALARGIRAAGAEPVVLVASDGGDGLLDALAGELVRTTRYDVAGPLGTPVDAPVGWFDRATALIESSRACGLALVPPGRRDPERTTTRGVGELIRAACDAGAETIVVGLGGSATMDGGRGLLGVLPDPVPARIVALCDVLVPLRGASRFAAQKGADRAAARRLAARLTRLAHAHPVEAALPGAGAAGGLGFGLAVHAGATLVPGAAWVLERVGLAAAVERADFVMVTEGAYDGTSGDGKLTGTVLERVSGRRPAGIVAPRVTRPPPPGVLVATGPGHWDAAAVARHAAALVRRASGA